MELILHSIKNILYSTNIVESSIRAILVLIITFLIVKVAKKIFSKSKVKNTLIHKFIKNITIYLLYLIGIITSISQLPQLNQITKTIIAGSGIIALAVSLSAQESLNNIISGLFIILFKPFDVGDRITLVNSNITGTVEDITLRHTVIKTFINSRVVVPNSTINKEVIENSNLIDSRASSFVDVYVAYESDIDKAIEIMANIIGSHPMYVDTRDESVKDSTPLVPVFIRELGNSGVCLRASMWTKTVSDNFNACSDARLKILKSFKNNNIEIPYTKYDVKIHK